MRKSYHAVTDQRCNGRRTVGSCKIHRHWFSVTAPVLPGPTTLKASSFGTVVITAQEPAIWDAERCCERREEPLVNRLAGLEPLNRACQDTRGHGEFVDTVPACDPKAEDPRR